MDRFWQSAEIFCRWMETLAKLVLLGIILLVGSCSFVLFLVVNRPV
jgi:hypothetical protein